jgi:hypothetical protein
LIGLVNRVENYKLYSQSALRVKINSYGVVPSSVFSVKISAGLYKPSLLTLQHNLIFASLVGKPPMTRYQTHGKRKKRTVSLNANLIGRYVFPVLDKLVYEILPILSDFKTPKWRKGGASRSYALRIRQKFMYYDQFEDLITNQMHDSYRGVFLPLNVSVIFATPQPHSINEICLRSMHLPVSLFKRNPRPAFDDPVSFE